MTDATLVDTKILSDIATDDPAWADWSLRQLEVAAARGDIVVNPVIYGELSVRFPDPAETDAFLRLLDAGMREIPRAALFLAGRVHLRYRRAGGSRTGVLSDFFIGAQAAVRGWPILTRDARRYRAHFPTVRLILPPG